jgi:hypothetical protein
VPGSGACGKQSIAQTDSLLPAQRYTCEIKKKQNGLEKNAGSGNPSATLANHVFAET